MSKVKSEKGDSKNLKTEKAPKKMSLEALLDRAEKKELIDFILQATKYNAELKVKIEMFFAGNSGEDLTETYRKAILAALKLVKVRYGYIETADLKKGLKPLKDLLKKSKTSLATKDYRDVFSISKAIIETLSDKMNESTWEDHASDDLYEFIEEVLENMKKVVVQPIAPFLQDEIFSYFSAQMIEAKYATYSIFGELFDLVVELADDAEKLKLLETNLNLMEKTTFRKSTWRQESYRNELLQMKAYLYEKQGRDKELWQLYEQRLDIDNFRSAVIKRYEETGNLDAAEALLKEGLGTVPERYSNSVWFKPYLELLQKRNKTADLRLLTAPYIKPSNFNEEYFTLWKSTFTSAEWVDAVETVLVNFENSYKNSRENRFADFSILYSIERMARLMSGEGAWERLKTAMLMAKSFDEMAIFEKYLGERYTKERAEKYLALIKVLLPNASGEAGHKPIVMVMRKIWEIPEYQIQVQQLVTSYRNIYKMRPSLMDLLNKYTW
jgi:hypothetical protein